MPKGHKITTIDAAELMNSRVHHPVPSGARVFGAPRLPESFQVVVDPRKHPTQPWRDLPKPTGQSPYHLSLDSVLSSEAMNTISKSGRMIFHAVGDTGGINTPTQIENV